MRTQVLKTIGATAAALTLATAPAYAGTGPGTDGAAEVGATACGWDPTYNGAYYNHCNSIYNVWIRVERHAGNTGYDKCVVPGLNYLGSLSDIAYAWYKGSLC